MAELVAELKHARKVFGKQVVLEDITLELEKGQILGLIGPSGSGKTTAIKCLLGMEKLDAGEALVYDKRMPNRKVLNHIGYMGQELALYENLSAKENLKFFGNLKGLAGDKLNSEIDDYMKLVDLEGKLKDIVNTFSGGMKRRLSLAITLLAHPDLLILDEPTVGIDPSLRQSIWRELRQLSEAGQTILMTTHVMDEAERCDKVGLLVDGHIFALGTPAELKQRFNADSIEAVFLKAEEAKDNEI
ncbi:putative ABC transporter [Staphylococcus piscifermentans]|uniref:Glycosyl transferase family 2 n=1 Tax=Staphylococcus piscifermentans TaxID=70258 RepID=A0A239TKH8_9STAP|nr:ABC transporter ATP-binding protein [Staphylococcus piscifermentans]RTX86218.1 ABC transporter ATP-binding protein [Staphylococcus piscifermentans]GEP84847.1 glycosyl transferase family 2 [Staphylococcus piscifermentans]SNU98220.1 putative ABC transporter [Staphylococcus piscifermentans]